MDKMKTDRLILDEILNKLTASNKCEFDRRFNIVFNSKSSIRELVKLGNSLHELHDNETRKRKKNELIVAALFAALVFSNYFQSSPSISYYFLLLALALSYNFILIESKIADSTFQIQHSQIKIDKDRYANDINQFGRFYSISDADLFIDFEQLDDHPENLKNKIIESQRNEIIRLKIEILESMYLYNRPNATLE